MDRKKICTMLAAAVACMNILPVWGITPEQNNQIEGNSIVIGNHLFELDTNGKEFTLNRFMNAIRSIEGGKGNTIYYKDYKGHWYELVEDPMLTKVMGIEQITNNIEHIFGSIDKEISKDLLQKHISILPTGFEESKDKAGTFDQKVTVTLSNQTTATFKDFKAGEVDSISGASAVNTLPKGLTLTMKKISDKQIELSLEGIAVGHDSSINTTPSPNDYNENGIYGDIKLLMLPELFEQVETVEEGGVYAACDVLYKGDSVDSDGILNLATQKIFNVEQVHYGVLELQKGTVEDYHITLNGEAIRPTPVDDRGTLFKFEINPLEVAQVQLTSKENLKVSETINLGTGKEPFTGVIQDEDPQRILTSGPVSYFDYHLSNYNQDGQARMKPTKATFNLVNEGQDEVDKTLPQLYAKPTDMGEDIVVTFEGTSAKSKQWKENIYAVYVDYGMSENTRVPVQFEIGDEKINIKAESVALQDRNGKHNLIIKSNGHNDARITAEIVKEAGRVMLAGDFGPWAHQDLLFELYDFNYGIINPIYEVILDGVKLNGECKDYHVVSNLVRLEKECLDKLSVGEHTLVIKAEGFKDFVHTFILEKAPNGEQNPVLGENNVESHQAPNRSKQPVRMDAVSGASSGGSGDSGGGGTGIMRANVIFDFDLIANAKILGNLNRTTPYASKVLEWWQSLTKDAIIMPDGEDKLVDYQYFKNYASIQAKDYITFKELYKTLPKQDNDMMTKEHPGIYLNRPYNVKNMLEDGLLGDVYPYHESSAKKSPVLSGTQGYYGDDIIISYDGIEDISKWENAIQKVMSGVSYLSYTLDPLKRQIIISTTGNGVVYGKNTIRIQADGYTTANVQISIHKRNESTLEVSKDEQGNIYITGLSAEFAKAVKGLSIDGKNLFNDSQVGEGRGNYALNGEVMTLWAKNFQGSDGTQKTLKIVADGYNDVYVQFTPNRTEDVNGGQLAEVPAFVELSSKNSYEVGEDVLLMGSSLSSNYKVQEVYVNDIKVPEYASIAFGEVRIAGSYFNEVGSYNIKLKASGYKDKVIQVGIIEKNTSQLVPDYVQVRKPVIEVGDTVEVTMGSFMDSTYVKAFTQIEVDGETIYTREDLGVTNYSSSVNIKNLQVGKHTLVLHANGYKDKVIEVEVKLKEVPQIVKVRIDKETMPTDQVTTTTGSAIKIVLGEPQYSTNKTYLDELQTVEVNERVYVKEDLEILEENIGLFNRIKFIQINADVLKEGLNAIHLKATKYKNKKFEIIITKN